MPAKIMEITPTMAKQFLENRKNNRTVRTSRVKQYASDMKNSLWKLNGETIIFDNNGRLLDGQHRLLACIESDCPFQTYVVFGDIDPESMPTLDTGIARSPGDSLMDFQMPEINTTAAAVRWIHRYRTNQIEFESNKMSRNELIQFVKENGISLYESVVIGRRTSRYLSGSMAAGFHWLASQIDREKANQFFVEIRDGGNYATNNVALKLREILIHNKIRARKLPAHHIWALLVKSWNLYRKGETLKSRLTWGRERQRNERMPKIEGL